MAQLQVSTQIDGPAVEAKFARLAEILRAMDTVCVAYSGGVDSAFLLAAAVQTLGASKVVAATGISPSLPGRERKAAADLARRLGCEYVEIDTTELADAKYAANSPQRCYFCKADLYGHLQEFCQQRGIRSIVNGANADDTGDWRPGMKAADDFAVRSPILQAGLTKAEVRFLSARMGLPTADKPAMACLASRFAYGTPVTADGLRMVEAAEDYLWSLGLRDFRVRHHESAPIVNSEAARLRFSSGSASGEHGENASGTPATDGPRAALARIELPVDQIVAFAQPDRRADLVARLKQIGYTYVTLDLQGFRSGSGNEVLK